MPTERFYRLSDRKQRTIHEAAFREFSRVPLDKVSINQIIKDAEISRGSFYTYFDDKWDVLSYILEESQKEMQKRMYKCLGQTKGDIWSTLEAFFIETAEYCNLEENKNFLKKVMKVTDSDDMFLASRKHRKKEIDVPSEDLVRQLYLNYSRESMRDMKYQEFSAFFLMALAAMAVDMRRLFEGMTMDEVLESFRMKMNILKLGVFPADEQEKRAV